MSKSRESEKLDILVYGLDRFDYSIEKDAIPISIQKANYNLIFREFKTEDRFQDYDGVILFQSTFEEFETGSGSYGTDHYTKMSCYKDELLRRENQLSQLIAKGGFACFLVIKPFIDFVNYGDANISDLAKRVLNLRNFYRKAFAAESTDLQIKRNEFTAFLNAYGCARNYFNNLNESLDIKPVSYCGNYLTGFLLWNRYFFLPVLMPDKRQREFKDFFTSLADSLVSCFKKLSQEIPNWVDQYRFPKEEKLINEKEKLVKKLCVLDQELEVFRNYKKCLCYDGELLNDSIISILESGFSLKVDPEDDLREDLKILDESGDPIILVENKGTNKGVKREFINQADSHRERSGLSKKFPSVLIVNTNIKSSNSIKDKYQGIAEEQVKHAAQMRILVLRTIDLLNLLYLKETGKINSSKLLGLFTNKSGWLNATTEGYSIEKGD